MHEIVLGGAEQYFHRKKIMATQYLSFTIRIVMIIFQNFEWTEI
jgi:hypothetical protein